MTQVHVLAVLQAKAGKADIVRRDLTDLSEASRVEEGNIRYELFEDANDPHRFIIIEHWKDAASQENHHNLSDHIRHFHENGDTNVEKRELFCFMQPVV